MPSRTRLSDKQEQPSVLNGEGAVAQPKQSPVQSECHDSEMLHQVAGPRCQTTALLVHLHNGSEPCLSHE